MSSASQLPQFLQPLAASTSVGSIDAQFQHSVNLGGAKSHCLWWPNADEQPLSTVLLFVPGTSSCLVVSNLRAFNPNSPFDFFPRKPWSCWILYPIPNAHTPISEGFGCNSSFSGWTLSRSRTCSQRALWPSLSGRGCHRNDRCRAQEF